MTAYTGAERPVRNRTPWPLSTWVARTLLVSPPEQGGALPTHDTPTEQRIDWELSPSRPPTRTLDTFNATNHATKQAEPTITGRDHEGSALAVLVRRTWSIALGAVAMWLTWAVVQLVDPADALVTVTITAIGICTALLVTAHAMTERHTTAEDPQGQPMAEPRAMSGPRRDDENRQTVTNDERNRPGRASPQGEQAQRRRPKQRRPADASRAKRGGRTGPGPKALLVIRRVCFPRQATERTQR